MYKYKITGKYTNSKKRFDTIYINAGINDYILLLSEYIKNWKGRAYERQKDGKYKLIWKN